MRKNIIFKIIVILFLLDRLLKIIVLNTSKFSEVFLIPRILSLDLYKNFGTAFGFKIPNFLIISFSFFVVFLIIFLIKKEIGKKIPMWVLLFLILGSISNLYDRIFYGFVIDTFNFLNISFFNIADGMILVGLVGIFWYWRKD